MNTHADRTQKNKSQAMANDVSQKQSDGETSLQFMGDRPEAIQMRKLQEMADNSPQVRQLMAFQEMANNSPQAKQAAQLQAMADNYSARLPQLVQKKENPTGMPDNLKSGIEHLSGYSMDDVKVHYNSDKPAQLQAHAYTQGTDIHLASGQEKHLPHEAWHVAQQKQGRVQPTMQMKGKVNINDDKGLESEAEVMGQRAAAITGKEVRDSPQQAPGTDITSTMVVQRAVFEMPDNNLTLDSGDLQVEELDGPSVGLNAELGRRVCNAAFMRFTVSYSLTNNSDAERNISIGLIQNGVADNVTGQYQSADGDVREIAFGRDDLPFLDGGEEAPPYYSDDAHQQHDGLEPGEIVEGQLTIDDRVIVAIPNTITSPQDKEYTSTGLSGERRLRIWLGIMENNNVVATIPMCTWSVNLENGKVKVGAGGGVPVT